MLSVKLITISRSNLIKDLTIALVQNWWYSILDHLSNFPKQYLYNHEIQHRNIPKTISIQIHSHFIYWKFWLFSKPFQIHLIYFKNKWDYNSSPKLVHFDKNLFLSFQISILSSQFFTNHFL